MLSEAGGRAWMNLWLVNIVASAGCTFLKLPASDIIGREQTNGYWQLPGSVLTKQAMCQKTGRPGNGVAGMDQSSSAGRRSPRISRAN